jgi:hypothetical protein
VRDRKVTELDALCLRLHFLGAATVMHDAPPYMQAAPLLVHSSFSLGGFLRYFYLLSRANIVESYFLTFPLEM